MATSQLNLADLFGAAATALSQNQGALNQTDSYNQNHGDNMVQIFNLINQAIAEKPKAPPSDQLAYAGRMVRSQSKSGSAQVYAVALETASQQFQGKSLNSDNAMELITTLLSGGQAPQAPVTPQGTDLISALLGSFAGDEGASARSSRSQKDEPVIDAEDLMRGGNGLYERPTARGKRVRGDHGRDHFRQPSRRITPARAIRQADRGCASDSGYCLCSQQIKIRLEVPEAKKLRQQGAADHPTSSKKIHRNKEETRKMIPNKVPAGAGTLFSVFIDGTGACAKIFLIE